MRYGHSQPGLASPLYGNLVDPVILRNLLSQQAQVTSGLAAMLPIAEAEILSLVA